VLVIAAGCGGVLPPVQPLGDTRIAPDPVPAKAEFYVAGSELGDADVLARIRHRVRLKRRGRIALRPTGEAIHERPRSAANNLDEVLPVIDETRLRIRIVIEDDDARYALWIDRDDAWLALGAPAQLADRDGRIIDGAGVWTTLGAPIDVIDRVKGRRRVRIVDELLVLEGWVATSVLDHVWVVPPGDRTPTDMRQGDSRSWSPPKDPRPFGTLAKGTQVRARGQATAPVIASVRDEIVVKIAERGTSWTAVEVVRPHARVRGFVETTAVVPAVDDVDLRGTGSGHGFGMSHADRIEVPAGTCLFDGREGEVAGVQLAKSVRLGRRRAADGWSLVYVDNPWSVAPLYVRDISSDPKQPRWASCTAEPHHR
jgi:hypothetical protein